MNNSCLTPLTPTALTEQQSSKVTSIISAKRNSFSQTRSKVDGMEKEQQSTEQLKIVIMRRSERPLTTCLSYCLLETVVWGRQT